MNFQSIELSTLLETNFKKRVRVSLHRKTSFSHLNLLEKRNCFVEERDFFFFTNLKLFKVVQNLSVYGAIISCF